MADEVKNAVAAVEAGAQKVADSATSQWGWVRRSLAARPLTTAWGFFLVGMGLGTIAGGQIAAAAYAAAGLAVTHLP